MKIRIVNNWGHLIYSFGGVNFDPLQVENIVLNDGELLKTSVRLNYVTIHDCNYTDEVKQFILMTKIDYKGDLLDVEVANLTLKEIRMKNGDVLMKK